MARSLAPKRHPSPVHGSSENAQASNLRARRAGRPQKQAAETLGGLILDCAAKLFAAKGFAATSMEQVAAACGVGKDTLYRRYPSKADLFAGVVERCRTEVVTSLDEVLAEDGAPLERLRRFARKLLSVNLQPDLLALHRVALGEAVASSGVRSPAVADDPIMVRFARLVEAAQGAGLVRPGEPIFIAEQLLYATAIKPTLAAMLGTNSFADLDKQETYFEKAWQLFIGGASS